MALGAIYFYSSDFAAWKIGIFSYKGTDAYERIQRRMERLVKYVLEMADEEPNIDYVIRELKRSVEGHRQLMERR